MTPIAHPEAELALRRANRLSQATEELSKPSSRFPRIVVCMAPPLLMIPFGQSLAKGLGLTSQGMWMLVAVVAATLTLGYEVSLLQRKVAALTEIVRSSTDRSVMASSRMQESACAAQAA